MASFEEYFICEMKKIIAIEKEDGLLISIGELRSFLNTLLNFFSQEEVKKIYLENEDWVSVEDELPPCDGKYIVKGKFKDCEAFYDGVNFVYENGMKADITYWKKITKIKRYGKIKK